MARITDSELREACESIKVSHPDYKFSLKAVRGLIGWIVAELLDKTDRLNESMSLIQQLSQAGEGETEPGVQSH